MCLPVNAAPATVSPLCCCCSLILFIGQQWLPLPPDCWAELPIALQDVLVTLTCAACLEPNVSPLRWRCRQRSLQQNPAFSSWEAQTFSAVPCVKTQLGPIHCPIHCKEHQQTHRGRLKKLSCPFCPRHVKPHSGQHPCQPLNMWTKTWVCLVCAASATVKPSRVKHSLGSASPFPSACPLPCAEN